MDPGAADVPAGRQAGSFAHWDVSESVELVPDPDDLPKLFEAIETFGDRAGWPMDFALRVQLVLEEMVLNVMNHSGASEPAVLKMMSNEDDAAFEIIDRGVAFDPTEVAAPPERDASSLESMAVGGLGIHLVRSMTKEMSYRRADGANHLTLVLARSEE